MQCFGKHFVTSCSGFVIRVFVASLWMHLLVICLSFRLICFIRVVALALYCRLCTVHYINTVSTHFHPYPAFPRPSCWLFINTQHSRHSQHIPEVVSTSFLHDSATWQLAWGHELCMLSKHLANNCFQLDAIHWVQCSLAFLIYLSVHTGIGRSIPACVACLCLRMSNAYTCFRN